MADKLIDLVRKAKAVQTQHRSVTAGFGIDRQSYKERNGKVGNEQQQSDIYVA